MSQSEKMQVELHFSTCGDEQRLRNLVPSNILNVTSLKIDTDGRLVGLEM